MSVPLLILGAGPAGASAAIAARQCGAEVDLRDRSHFPRHKVCGEFLSPEIEAALRRLDVWEQFLALKPARVHRMLLNFGSRAKQCALPEPAWGLSRYEFDRMLLVGHAPGMAGDVPVLPTIVTTGRSVENTPQRGQRTFGFKAHYDGPQDDAVELYFLRG